MSIIVVSIFQFIIIADAIIIIAAISTIVLNLWPE